MDLLTQVYLSNIILTILFLFVCFFLIREQLKRKKENPPLNDKEIELLIREN